MSYSFVARRTTLVPNLVLFRDSIPAVNVNVVSQAVNIHTCWVAALRSLPVAPAASIHATESP